MLRFLINVFIGVVDHLFRTLGTGIDLSVLAGVLDLFNLHLYVAILTRSFTKFGDESLNGSPLPTLVRWLCEWVVVQVCKRLICCLLKLLIRRLCHVTKSLLYMFSRGLQLLINASQPTQGQIYKAVHISQHRNVEILTLTTKSESGWRS